MAKFQGKQESLEVQRMAMDDLEEGKTDGKVTAIVKLPTAEDITSQKVLQSVRGVFAGFNFSDNINFQSQFPDTESLAQYASDSLSDIRNLNETTERAHLRSAGAAMARFWYMARTMAKALREGNYGTNAAQRIATSMGVSVSYVYQIKLVGERLSEIDCYLLGVRGVDSTRLRKLATIKNDTTRQTLVNTFVDSYKCTGSRDEQEQYMVALSRAIASANASDSVELGTSLLPESTERQDDDYPEYRNLFKQVATWTSSLKKLAKEESVDALVGAAADFFIPSDFSDKAAALDKAREAVSTLQAQIAKLSVFFKDISSALASVEAMEVEDGDK